MDPLEQFERQIREAVKGTFAQMGADVPFEIEVPSTGVADFAVPCFPLAKVLRKAPAMIAEEAASKLPPMDRVSRAWAENGYLNFQLDDRKVNIATLGAIMQDSDRTLSSGRGRDRISPWEEVRPSRPISTLRYSMNVVGTNAEMMALK